MELKILPNPLKGQIIREKDIPYDDFHNPFINDTFFPKRIPHPPIGTPNTLSSIDGKMHTLVFLLHKNGIRDYNFHSIFTEIVERIDSIEQILVFYYNNDFDKDSHLYPLLSRKKPKIYPLKIENSYNFNFWVQDVFYPTIYSHQNQDDTTELTTYLITNKRYISDVTTKLRNLINNYNQQTNIQPPIKVKRSHFYFEGGNILADKKFILLGADSLKSNTLAEYKKWFGLQPIIIGNKEHKLNITKSFPSDREVADDGFKHEFTGLGNKQPLFHIDMFITLAGCNEKSEYIILVGEPVLGFDFPIGVPQDLFNFLYQWLTTIKEHIQDCILQLKKHIPHKVKIVRNPLVLTYEDTIIDSGNHPIRKWFWATYNNCLVEIYNNSKKVWLPSYGGPQGNYANSYPMSDIDKTKIYQILNLHHTQKIDYGDWSKLSKYDLWNKRIWESLSFNEVHLLYNNYIPLALNKGSLNCITNFIKRI